MELAASKMSERQRNFRAIYRERVAGSYNGFLHIAVIYTIGLTALYIYISNIKNVTVWSFSRFPRPSCSAISSNGGCIAM